MYIVGVVTATAAAAANCNYVTSVTYNRVQSPATVAATITTFVPSLQLLCKCISHFGATL